jgi:hypothetical protein
VSVRFDSPKVDTQVRNPALREHYRRFGLRPSASVDQINASFRKLSKDAHPDTGGSVAEFEALQDSRRLLLAAANVQLDLETSQRVASPPGPAWAPGAFLGLAFAVGVGVTGLVTADRSLILLGLGGAVALWAVVTSVIGLARAHRRNTRTHVVYPSAEDVIELREPDRPSSQRRRSESSAPTAEQPGQRAANSFSPVSSSANNRQPKI